MKLIRVAAAVPLAALPGCAPHLWTPSSALSGWSPDVPANVSVTTPPGEVAVQRWQLARSDPWAPFSKLTLLASLPDHPVGVMLPDVSQLEGVRQARCAARTLAEDLPGDTLWIVDLRGAESVAFGATLSELSPRSVSNVLTFNNWPAENGVVPADETLSALLQFSPRPAVDGPPSVPVFLLDAWRLAFGSDQAETSAYDNRYMLGAADFPDAQTLQANGIHRVMYVVDNLADTAYENDDLHEVLYGYQGARMPIAMVDLDALCGPAPRTIAHYFGGYPYHVWHRPLFAWQQDVIRRSRGGFGGARAVPVHLSGGFHGSGGGHGGGG
jgi:hypothetical protein